MEGLPPYSSSLTHEWTYDVFLNFRGKDTRFDFTRNLYNALHRKGILTFMDDEGIRGGQEITPALLKAIQESRIAITIFSRNYASSTFCLDELVKILECIKEKGRLVLPVFYAVDPSEVRNQRENYRQEFAKHEKRFKNDEGKVRKWRQALQDAANLSGLHFTPGKKYESHLIEEIVKEVSRRINRSLLHIADFPVGLESRVPQVISLLAVGSNERVQMVGICGTGGIGKTTIARAVYNLIADSYEGICFLADVRENSTKHCLEHLQGILLSKIVGEDIKLEYVHEGIPTIKRRLHRKKVLLILDDVDKLKQLKALAGGLDWFGLGSRIIITSRDKHLLASHGVERIYEVESLNQEEALELLTWNAFRQNKVEPSYLETLNNVVLYACGLPLALEVIGSNLFGRAVDDWGSALDSYRRIPIKEILQILKVSYDALGKYEQEIFLDIACCFKGETFEYVTTALYARDIHPNNVIKVLIDKCLIKIDSGDVIMHHIIQDMGREIVRQQSPKNPGKRTRLWFHDDILQVLEENKGTEKIEAINIDMPTDKEVEWSGGAFKKMPNLKILIIRKAHFSTGPKYLPNSLKVLDWKGYPYPSLPSNFYPKKLIILRMPESCLKLDEQLKKFQFLNVMDFTKCEFIREVPDLFGVPNLTKLRLDYCTNLIEVHDSIGLLDKLKRLSFHECRKLKTLPGIRSPSLEFLDLSFCSTLQRFPEILGMMEHIRAVYLYCSGIQELPFSIRNLIGLKKLDLTYCHRLREVRGIPPNLTKFSAELKGWSWESGSMFLSQALRIVGSLKFRTQEERMLEFLDHYTVGNSVSIWFRTKFPVMAAYFTPIVEDVVGEMLELSLWITIQINGMVIGFRESKIIDTSSKSLPILVFDLHHLVSESELESVVLKSGWNHVKISYESAKYRISAEHSGFLMCKQKCRMEDIRFTDPSEESVSNFLEGSSTSPNSFV